MPQATKLTAVPNPTTGKTDYQFTARLVSIGETELENSNGKTYRVGTCEFVNQKGNTVQRTVQIYDGNLKDKSGNIRMQAGNDYLTTLSFDDKGNTYLRMSHLANASRATADDFELPVEETVETGSIADSME